MAKYKPIRIPERVYKKVYAKKIKMDEMITRLSGKKKSVPLTRVLEVMANQPVYLSDEELFKIMKKKQRFRKL